MPVLHTGKVDIAYRDEGQGEPLFMLMGLGAQLIYWPAGLVEMLLDAGFRVIRIDNRDAGESTHLEEAPAPNLPATLLRRALGLKVPATYDLYDMMSDAIAVLDGLRLSRVHVVGSSMGGMIGQCMAVHHPQRVASLTSIMSSRGDCVDFLAEPRAMRAFVGRKVSDAAAKEEVIVRTYQSIAGRRLRADESILREIAREAVARGVSHRGLARQIAAIAATGNRARELRRVQAPTMIIHGSEDPLIRPWAAPKLARSIPGARLHWIEGMGHGLPRLAWPQLTRLIVEHVGRAGTASRRAA